VNPVPLAMTARTVRIARMTSLPPPVSPVPADSTGSAAGFLIAEVAFLAAAHALGGPPWVVLGVMACLGQIMADFRLASLAPLLPALVWAGAHAVTGNRELFFPYAVYLAAHVAVHFERFGRGRAAAGATGIMATFLLIRVLQRGTPGVLAVELAVTVVILVGVLAAIHCGRGRPAIPWLVPLAASLAAYAGLAF
jgi:hypothetical protein